MGLDPRTPGSFAIVSQLTGTKAPQTHPKPTECPPSAAWGEWGIQLWEAPRASRSTDLWLHKDWSPAAWVFGEGKMGPWRRSRPSTF